MVGSITGGNSYLGQQVYRSGLFKQAPAVLRGQSAPQPGAAVEPVIPVRAVHPDRSGPTILGPVIREGADPAEMAVRMRIQPSQDEAPQGVEGEPVVANPENPVMSRLFLNNTLVLSKYFNKRENVRQHPGNYFNPGYPALYFFYNMLEMAFPLYSGLYTIHGPSPFQKGTFEELWEKEKQALTEMSHNRFRSGNDLTQYLFREWQKLSNNFCPKNVLRDLQYYNIAENNTKLVQTITKQKKKLVCINDARITGDFEQIKSEIQEAFFRILPEPSAFEK